jgi:RIO kinase 1
MNKYEAYEKYGDFEEEILFSVRGEGRAIRAKHGKFKNAHPIPKPTTKVEVTDFTDNVSDWVPTYAKGLDPQHHERQWLIDSLAPFYRENIITDVVHRVKGGKEANVYCCIAHHSMDIPLIAAKLYRPRTQRTLKNDAIYKAGRQLRDEEGKTVKGRREKLALAKKTRFGKHLDTVWWIGNEYGAQKKLFDSGAAVPRPIAHIGNTILMEYFGDEGMPAPTLIDVSLLPVEANDLFSVILENIKLMLDHHLVHGDLSPYNILYWEGDITIIDFPQIVDARTNPHAFTLLKRDIKRVCDYFARYGIKSNSTHLSRELWEPYMGNLP